MVVERLSQGTENVLWRAKHIVHYVDRTRDFLAESLKLEHVGVLMKVSSMLSSWAATDVLDPNREKIDKSGNRAENNVVSMTVRSEERERRDPLQFSKKDVSNRQH